MNNINLQIMQEIVQHNHLAQIYKKFSDEGLTCARQISELTCTLFKLVAPEGINYQLVVCTSGLNGGIAAPHEHLTTLNLNDSVLEYLTNRRVDETLFIQYKSRDQIDLWVDTSPDISRLSNNTILYAYKSREECYYCGGDKLMINNPSSSHASIFSIPTFLELDDAIQDYKMRFASTCKCVILGEAWVNGFSGPKLFFISGPEFLMRRSLTQFLTSVLRNSEVRPEQNVDESHPVDIKVTWMFCNRIALIEIKWLGKSLKPDGCMSTTYSAARANEGAKQLAGYLDANRQQTPTHQTKGYLIIYDGRRKGLDQDSTSVTYPDGLHYRDKEIQYNPEYHKVRDDFVRPIRIFLEPICTPPT